MTTAYTVGSAYSVASGVLMPVPHADFDVRIDAADSNITADDYLRPLVASGVPEDVRVLFLDVVAREDERSEFRNIGYFATRFDPSDGSVLLVPGDLLEQEPRTWLGDDLRKDLLGYGRETLEEFSLHSLADYIGAK
jgi:hypothetical protein